MLIDNHRTRIKICGIKTQAVLAQAVSAGADAIGFMFYPQSIRYIAPQAASELAAQVPAFVNKVAVLVNPTERDMHMIIDAIAPHYLQFHGEESDDFCCQFNIPYIRAAKVNQNFDIAALQSEYAHAAAFLLDSDKQGMYGGTGTPFDWSLLTSQMQTFNRPVLLAGGLTPDNVASAVRELRPFAVDVSSGVETDGEKDRAKIAQFCAQVRTIDQQLNDNKQ